MTTQQDSDPRNMNLRPVTQQDWTAVSVLLDTAFDGPSEARLVDRLRREGHMAMELVAEDHTGILGYVAFAEMLAPAGMWSLSPVAVRQAKQGHGIGSELIRYALDEVRKSHDARAVVVLGAPEYYKRFGFSLKAAENLTTPFSKSNTMLFPIAPGSGGMQAALSYPAAFSEV
ncbi:GNAT family N-acetyltransferase [Actibacterium sp. D379-3]